MQTIRTYFGALILIGLALTAHAQDDMAGAPNDAAKVRQSGKIIGTGSEKLEIKLEDPMGGWTAARMLLVKGTVSDPSVNPITVSINGEKYLLRTVNGEFHRKFPITAGKNAVTVLGRNKSGAAEVSRSVFAAVAPVAIKLVLTSDTDNVYTDLHIYEPSQDLKDPLTFVTKYWSHVFWAQTESPSGGHFYLNEQSGDYDQPGYGPYLYTHSAPPMGIYRVDTNYWPSGDKGPVVGTLDVSLFGGTPNEITRKVKTPLIRQGQTVTLAWLKISKGQHAEIFVPNQDKLTAEQKKLWPDWVLNYKPADHPSEGGEGGD